MTRGRSVSILSQEIQDSNDNIEIETNTVEDSNDDLRTSKFEIQEIKNLEANMIQNWK